MMYGYGNMMSATNRLFSGGGGLSYLLDTYGSAVVGYSLRKIDSTYNGNVIRVRRSSDDAEEDIGLNGNLLDTSALTTFVGANDGFVVSWYDQSGNARAITQSTGANQPKIVSSGSLIVGSNGFPSIQTDGNDFFSNSGYTFKGSNSSVFCVWKANNGGSFQALFSSNNNDNIAQYFASRGTTSLRYFETSGDFSATALGTNDFLLSICQDSTPTALIQENNSTIYNSSSGISSVDADGLRLFRRVSATNPMANGVQMQEFIIFDSDLTSQISDVNTDINNYYSIY